MKKAFHYRSEQKLYQLQFTYDGRRYSVYGKTKKECEAKQKQKETDIEAAKHRHIDNLEITLEQFYSGWVKEQEQEVKPSTLYSYGKSWKYLHDYFGSMKVAEINKYDIQGFQHWMLSASKTETTVNNAIRLLKQLLNSAINDRIIDFNPANTVKKLKVRKEKATETNHRALTTQETRQFLEASAHCYYYHLFRFLLNTGCRIGEALALTWQDIDFKKLEIRINKTVSRTSNKGYEVMDTPKTACGNRIIPITETIKKILSEQKEQLNVLMIRTTENRVFPMSNGKTGNYNSVNVCIANIIKNINALNAKPTAEKFQIVPEHFAPFSVHAFRDTFATRCIEQGMQPNTLKTLLGHSSLKMTMDLYAHVMPNTKREELEKIQIAI